MTVSILQPEALTITQNTAQQSLFGGDQEWFVNKRARMDGCGPTCAANITAYLAWTRPDLRNLYDGEDRSKSLFAQHMENLYRFVTPGNMGLHRPKLFAEGLLAFANSRGKALKAHLFEVNGNRSRERQSLLELSTFVQAGLESDCPIAFLNLNRGKEKSLQNWHWITITSAVIDNTQLAACASDEGKQICFDLGQWYQSTRMRGGLVYFTQQ